MNYNYLMFNNFSSLRLLGCPLVIGLLVLVLPGCGGGGGDSTEQALTKAQYIKQADTICAKVEEKQQRALASYVKKHPEAKESQSGQEAAIVAALPPDKVGIEEIRSLTPPVADEQQLSSLLDEMEAALENLESESASVLTAIQSSFEEVNKRAEKYGFKVCDRLP